jgi:hypothetical protein
MIEAIASRKAENPASLKTSELFADLLAPADEFRPHRHLCAGSDRASGGWLVLSLVRPTACSSISVNKRSICGGTCCGSS